MPHPIYHFTEAKLSNDDRVSSPKLNNCIHPRTPPQTVELIVARPPCTMPYTWKGPTQRRWVCMQTNPRRFTASPVGDELQQRQVVRPPAVWRYLLGGL